MSYYTQPAYGFGKKPILEFDNTHRTVASHAQYAMEVMRCCDEKKAEVLAGELYPLQCMSDTEKVLRKYFIVKFI